MVSKCLNSQCSEVFKNLGRGRLFRIDYTEQCRRGAMTGKNNVVLIRSKATPVEHFWLCDKCASTMTVQFSEIGEVILKSLKSLSLAPLSVHNAETARGRTAS
jgi:hypothetical protein